jgi:hypothetical protein
MSLFADETESELEELEQDVYHVLIETLGSNLDDVTRGLGLDDVLSDDEANLASVPGLAEHQVQLDDRVVAAKATLTQDEDGNPRLEVQIQPTDETLGTATVTVTGKLTGP